MLIEHGNSRYRARFKLGKSIAPYILELQRRQLVCGHVVNLIRGQRGGLS